LIETQIRLGETAVEISKAHGRRVDVLEATPSDRIEQAYGGQESDCLAGRGEQLLDGALVIARFSEDALVDNGNLIGANYESIAVFADDSFRFFSRQQ
jgi:hypothetical protein